MKCQEVIVNADLESEEVTPFVIDDNHILITKLDVDRYGIISLDDGRYEEFDIPEKYNDISMEFRKGYLPLGNGKFLLPNLTKKSYIFEPLKKAWKEIKNPEGNIKELPMTDAYCIDNGTFYALACLTDGGSDAGFDYEDRLVRLCEIDLAKEDKISAHLMTDSVVGTNSMIRLESGDFVSCGFTKVAHRLNYEKIKNNTASVSPAKSKGLDEINERIELSTSESHAEKQILAQLDKGILIKEVISKEQVTVVLLNPETRKFEEIKKFKSRDDLLRFYKYKQGSLLMLDSSDEKNLDVKIWLPLEGGNPKKIHSFSEGQSYNKMVWTDEHIIVSGGLLPNYEYDTKVYILS